MKEDDLNAHYEKAKAMLVGDDGQPSAMYQTYLRFRQEYTNKKKEYADAYANAIKDPQRLPLWPVEGKAFIDEVDQAWEKWIVMGFKNEVERAINIMSANPGYADAAGKL